jgi:hypothetical protein
MGANKLSIFLNQHCRFVLRSGKEVFGVIWEVQSQGNAKYFFSSVSEHRQYLEEQNLSALNGTLQVNLEDIIHAEKLVG